MLFSKIHIANTQLEWELESDPTCSLIDSFHRHPVYLQLQFLPLLYAEPEEAVLVTAMPALDCLEGGVPLQMESFSGKGKVESWGASPLIKKRFGECDYEIPPIEVVRKMNSKAFSFTWGSVAGGALLHSDEEVKRWLAMQQGPVVFKTCYGVSGRGHFHDSEWSRLRPFLKREWDKNRPVIAEPWVTRVLDFSTQWEIRKDRTVHYVGSTLCENNARGQYGATIVGEEKSLFSSRISFLEKHCEIARAVLAEMGREGYFGHVGIDAMIYSQNGGLILQPVVEVNARKTMGWVALQFQRRRFPSEFVRLSYTSAKEGLLPSSIKLASEKIVSFQHNLNFQVSPQMFNMSSS